MAEEEKPIIAEEAKEPQQEQLPLEQSAAEAIAEETPAAEIKSEPEIISVSTEPSANKEEAKKEEFPAFAPATEKTKDENEAKMPVSKIVGIIIVLLVVLTVIFYATRKPAADTADINGQKVTVSGAPEQGKVNIIEETKNDINVLVENGDEAAFDKVKIIAYLGNTQKNPNSADCALTYPLEREIDRKYDSNMINTMLGLLEPLTAVEKEQGFVSAIPGGTYLKYLKLDDSGVMSVNLTGNISRAAGSCAVTAIKAQIKATIMQFAAVKSVVICIDGNCDESDILQP